MYESAYAANLKASGFPGRWNSKGNEEIYCCNDASFAYLENMIRRSGICFSNLFSLMTIDYPNVLSILWLQAGDQKPEAGWKHKTSYSVSQPIGDAWYAANKACIIKVPSVLIPQSFNIVFNTKHPDFKRVKLINVAQFIPNERFEVPVKNGV